MRGADITQQELFSYRTLKERIPKDHPLQEKRGDQVRLCSMEHALMKTRIGLAVDMEVTHATGTAEWNGVKAMVGRIVKEPGAPAAHLDKLGSCLIKPARTGSTGGKPRHFSVLLSPGGLVLA